MPMVEQAQKAVGSIKKEHLNELKSLRMPPEPVHDVLSAVLRMMGRSDNSWNAMKSFLGEGSMISNIINYDPRLISMDIRKNVNNFVKKH
mmetsp:Transcript_26840/g.4866  ORF Transcript_26840/g.4866 Transcript_26840/m.4866 type:complete len:90 (+) Transcript_26840:3770-4039(+)|eukprot:CAMPEP_0168317610 /NCGR_PEP_ID=MMETSP0210-20121227/26206_1 /TAXON_ID=40633 /ORGANISM="Condylostoma magnum, Strain COL2" /LENGTH=89 /DNA_ID=CAMNT_0008318525 /DNA_START=1618 /DNA_END=1887 /DNA_ORIENTATION=+